MKANNPIKAVLKELKSILILSGAFIIFSEFIANAYNDYIVEPILSKATQNIYTDVIFAILLLIYSYTFLIKVKKDYYIKTSQVCFCLIVLSFYVYFRVAKAEAFLSFNLLYQVKYFDFIFLYFSFPILLKVASFIKPKLNRTKSKTNLYLDKHITTSIEDILGRASKAKRIFHEIQDLESEQSIAIGIVGEWGSGKTSFLYMIKEAFQNEDNGSTIVVDFNPWLNINLDSIIQDYFNTLENELKDYSIDVSKNIKKYANSVLNINKNSLTESILKGTNLVFEASLTDEFKNLNQLLKKLNKRVIVFIDDFDRLQANEIFEILKLIRNTAGFDTFTYVVAYDKSYLINSLKSFNIPNPENFSEKIFLKELELLPVTNEQISKYIQDELTKLHPDKKADILDLFEGGIDRYFPVDSVKKSTAVLKHIRDVNRFLNSFLNDYAEIKDEVSLNDYFILKLIKFKFYNVYILLFSNRDEFLEKEEHNSSANKNLKFIPKKSATSKNATEYYNVFKNSLIEEHLKEVFKYDENNLSAISSLFNNIFSKSSFQKNNLSICYEVNYYKYFKDELSSIDLSVKQFEKTMALPTFEQIEKDLIKWEKEGKIEAVRFYLNDSNIYDLKDKNQYENYIKSMFRIAKFSRIGYSGRDEIAGFDFDILWRSIDNRRNKIVDKYYSNIAELKAFIMSLLDNAEPPYDFESILCYYLDEKLDIGSDVIDKLTLRRYLVKYFREYANSTELRTEKFWMLFYRCNVTEWTQVNSNTYTKDSVYLDEAIEVFKEYMINHLDDFLVIFVSTQSFYGNEKNDNKLGIHDIATTVFGSLQNFIDFLKSENVVSKQSVFLEEFTKFAEEVVKQNKMIEFDFVYPPANQKLKRLVESQGY